MAITPLTAPWKKFTFDGVTSASFGVAILGEGVFNAPERDVEVIAIPGRNGSYILDHGRFENIEVTYPCTLATDDTADFAEAISDLRNYLCSKTTYCRLEDDYNTGEYRLATYKSGLEIEDEQVLRIGTFDITFECKPQRYLTSGETKLTLTSGDTVTNPTLFESKPMIEAYGDGSIDIGGQTITIEDTTIGNTLLASAITNETVTFTQTLDVSALNVGDDINVGTVEFLPHFMWSKHHISSATITSSTHCTVTIDTLHGIRLDYTLTTEAITFDNGTASTFTASFTSEFVTGTTYTVEVDCSVGYDGDETITYSWTYAFPLGEPTNAFNKNAKVSASDIYGTSTKSAIGMPMYIDLDTGECYNIEGGSATSVNDAVSLPAELPSLKPGANTITFDNTFTQVDLIPRWWKV